VYGRVRRSTNADQPGRNIHGLKSVLLFEAALGLEAPCALVTKEEISLKQIHPELLLSTVRCTSCGTTFATRSTRRELVVDACSNCHPAYTGVTRAATTGTRVERFERRRRLATERK
jgi:large subunit ribosomal protein L31